MSESGELLLHAADLLGDDIDANASGDDERIGMRVLRVLVEHEFLHRKGLCPQGDVGCAVLDLAREVVRWRE